MKENVELKTSIVKFYEENLRKRIKSFVPLCYHPGGIETTEEILKEAKIGKDSHVLDVASGIGDTAIYLAANVGSRVTGIDLSQEMVAYANTLVKEVELDPHITFLMADAENLPFKDNVFDVAISECSLCLVPNTRKALCEMKRVIKPEAKVVVSDVVLKEKLSPNLNNFLSYASCIAGAKTLGEYINEFEKAGLTRIITADLSFQVVKQICQYLENQKTSSEEIVKVGESLVTSFPERYDMKTFQTISFYLWLTGKIGYYMISGVKTKR
ncbi:MAG: methyltransferase domain-containing protein [Candidatus Bathyarchaeia archaeon]